jgi:hypothetical protein
MSDCSQSDSASYFLSYSRADQLFALRLAEDLRAQGVAIFVDQWDIRPSEHWDRAIERAVGCCRGLVVIISPRSVVSDNVMDEVSFAIDNRKSVLPVMIEKCTLPLRITRMHLIDGTGTYETVLKQCLAELKHPSRQSGRSPTPAVEPVRKPLDPEAISAARLQLATILGPIATIVVDKEAARAASVKDLYGLLAQHIGNGPDRERFLATAPVSVAAPAAAPQPAQPPSGDARITADELNSISSTLTEYLGPIAPVVAKRESRSCASAADLRQRLAAMIPVEQDRSDFLRRLTD